MKVILEINKKKKIYAVCQACQVWLLPLINSLMAEKLLGIDAVRWEEVARKGLTVWNCKLKSWSMVMIFPGVPPEAVLPVIARVEPVCWIIILESGKQWVKAVRNSDKEGFWERSILNTCAI